MRYIDGLKVLESDDAANPLIIGQALHTGIERGTEAAIQEYYNSFPIISNAHVNEAIKLEIQIEKARAALKRANLSPEGCDLKYEVKIEADDFTGFIDLLVPRGYIMESTGKTEVFDIYDFKYSNNIEHYMKSRQLHLYKYYFEQTHPGTKVLNTYFLFVPKNNSKQKQTENLYQFRKRIVEEITPTEVTIRNVPFDCSKVTEHFELVRSIMQETRFEANERWLCNYCEYYDVCQKGKNYMILPSVERRNISETKRRKIWIYGAAFSGKTTMLDEAPNPLNLNTDGNIQFVTMPYISIKDEVKVEGRITKRKFAWEVFKDAIAELEKRQNDFKTIIVDLLEDTREMCRVFMYDQLKIQHESDSGFGKGWDIIKTEYLSTIRRLFNLDYENIVVISHEDVSKDITKKNGQNITRIAPNIQDAVANKIAGMVDIVARVVVEDDGARTLNFKQNEVIFGGGRLKGIQETTIPLSWAALMQVYEDANASVGKVENSGKTAAKTRSRKTKEAEKPVEEPSTDEQPLERSDVWTPGGGEVDDSIPMNPPEEADAEPEKPRRTSRRSRKPETVTHVEPEVLTEDTYFYIPSDDNYVLIHAGNVAPEGGKIITKEEFGEGIKRIATEDNDKPPFEPDEPKEKAAPGRRTRRSRK